MERILSRYKDEWCVTKIVWEIKCNKITLSGPFDPAELEKKLCCLACRIIKDFEIPKPPEPPEPPPKEKKPCPCPPPSPPHLIYVKGQICICGKPKPPPPPPKEDPPKEDPPKPCPLVVCHCTCVCEKPKETKPEPPPPTPPPSPPPIKVTCECVCEKNEKSCHKSNGCDGGYNYDPCRCNYPPPDLYGRGTCQFVYEDAPNGCTIM